MLHHFELFHPPAWSTTALPQERNDSALLHTSPVQLWSCELKIANSMKQLASEGPRASLPACLRTRSSNYERGSPWKMTLYLPHEGVQAISGTFAAAW